MKGYLLDVNVLLALAWPNHVHHRFARKWLAKNQFKGWAMCTLTQVGFVRLSSHPRLSEANQTPAAALALMVRMTKQAHYLFWREPTRGLSNNELQLIFDKVITHQQVTDAYLIGLARVHKGRVATFDRGLCRLFPEDTLLIASDR
jgi:toxin-antitoxin system PIN domain toxin